MHGNKIIYTLFFVIWQYWRGALIMAFWRTSRYYWIAKILIFIQTCIYKCWRTDVSWMVECLINDKASVEKKHINIDFAMCATFMHSKTPIVNILPLPISWHVSSFGSLILPQIIQKIVVTNVSLISFIVSNLTRVLQIVPRMLRFEDLKYKFNNTSSFLLHLCLSTSADSDICIYHFFTWFFNAESIPILTDLHQNYLNELKAYL